MNTGYLFEVAADLKRELDKTGQVKLLAQLVTHIQAQISHPQQTQHESLVGSTRTQLTGALRRAQSNTKTSTWVEAVAELGFSDLIGSVLADRIDQIFTRQGITQSQVEGEIAQIAAAMKSRTDQLGQLVGAMTALGLKESKPSGASTVFTLVVPRRAISSDALELSRDLQDAQDLVKTVDEYLTGHRSPVTVLQISSSDYHFDFAVAAKVAAFLAKAVSAILGWYKSILDLRKTRAELAEKSVPKAVLQPIDEHIENRTQVGVREAVGKLLDGFESAVDAGRKNELAVELELRLNWTANRIDRGYKFDVRALQPAKPPDSAGQKDLAEDTRHLEDVVEFSGKLRFVSDPNDRILKLPEPRKNTSDPDAG